MSLRKRTIILVTLLLVSAVMSATAIGIVSTRNAFEDQQEAYGELVARLLSRTTDIVGEFPQEMEDAIGEQMIVEATIASHMVAMAEEGGYTTEEITQHLKAIADSTELDEFWITDETGFAYLHNIDGINFTFSGDPETNPQAYIFWDLITGEKSSVVQETEPRDVDKQPYKYAGVGGVDKPRIVQVGYNAKKIEDLRDRVSIGRLAGLWVDSGEIEAIRVVDQTISTVALRPEEGIPDQLTDLDIANLERAVTGDETVSYVEGNYRKVIVPIHEKSQGEPNRGAVMVYFSNAPLQKATYNLLVRGLLVAVIIISLGILASIWLSRVIAKPIQQVMDAATAVQNGTYRSDLLAGVTSREDEIGRLGRVFDGMAREVSARDRRLNLLRVIIPIGVAMSAERDFNRLLETIVVEAQKITNAEGGTLYLRENSKLKFVIVRNEKLGVALGGTTGREVTFPPLELHDKEGKPNNQQIATCAALKAERISVEDAYDATDYDFSGTKAFDNQTGYRTQSVLAVPLLDDKNTVIGVIQLINARDPATGSVIPFEEDDVTDSLSLITSAALSAYIREEQLRQEITKLRIEVDLVKQAKQVAEITETDYFQQLQAKAKKLRGSNS